MSGSEGGEIRDRGAEGKVVTTGARCGAVQQKRVAKGEGEDGKISPSEIFVQQLKNRGEVENGATIMETDLQRADVVSCSDKERGEGEDGTPQIPWERLLQIKSKISSLRAEEGFLSDSKGENDEGAGGSPGSPYCEPMHRGSQFEDAEENEYFDEAESSSDPGVKGRQIDESPLHCGISKGGMEKEPLCGGKKARRKRKRERLKAAQRMTANAEDTLWNEHSSSQVNSCVEDELKSNLGRSEDSGFQSDADRSGSGTQLCEKEEESDQVVEGKEVPLRRLAEKLVKIMGKELYGCEPMMKLQQSLMELDLQQRASEEGTLPLSPLVRGCSQVFVPDGVLPKIQMIGMDKAVVEETETIEDEVFSREDDSNEDDDSDDDNDIQCDKYDGTLSAEAYLKHFQAVSEINGWSEEENLAQLKVALEGPVAQFMMYKRDWTFDSLCAELCKVFGMERCRIESEIELGKRVREKGETLRSFYRDIHRLVGQAYPGEEDPLRDRLAIDVFTRGLNDKDLALQVLNLSPVDLKDACSKAEMLEMNRQIVSQYAVKGEEQGGERLAEQVDSLQQEVKELKAYINSLEMRLEAKVEAYVKSEPEMVQRQPILTADKQTSARESLKGIKRCYQCGGGHLRRHCPQLKGVGVRFTYPEKRIYRWPGEEPRLRVMEPRVWVGQKRCHRCRSGTHLVKDCDQSKVVFMERRGLRHKVKACFRCRSIQHLIRDCPVIVKARTPVEVSDVERVGTDALVGSMPRDVVEVGQRDERREKTVPEEEAAEMLAVPPQEASITRAVLGSPEWAARFVAEFQQEEMERGKGELSLSIGAQVKGENDQNQVLYQDKGQGFDREKCPDRKIENRSCAESGVSARQGPVIGSNSNVHSREVSRVKELFKKENRMGAFQGHLQKKYPVKRRQVTKVNYSSYNNDMGKREEFVPLFSVA